MKFEGFIGGAYRMDSLPISAQRCINWYPEGQTDPNASSNLVLQPTPGYKILTTISGNGIPKGSFCRGIYRTSKGIGVKPESSGSVIVVIGPKVFWLKQDNSYSLLGSISNLDSKVTMIDDGFGLIIADGVGLYRMELETKVFKKLSFDLTNPTQVEFFAGYTIAIGTQQNLPQNTFFYTDKPYDNEVWGALDYASAEQSQDPLTGMMVAGNYIYLMGPNSHETWTSTSDKDLPFVRAYATSGAVGLHAPKSLCKIGNNIFFLGTTNQGNKAVYTNNGTDMVKVSTLALEQEWSSKDVTDCTAWVYSDAGHDFILFNFDAADKTYVYDPGNQLWHERASRDQLTDTLHRWEPNFCIQRNGSIIVGDRYSTNLYLLSRDYCTENGNNILRVRTTSHQNAEQVPCMFRSVRFDMDTGHGITKEDVAGRYTKAPTIMFRYSYDRGHTWGSESRQPFGATGEYQRTVEYPKLGVSRNLTVEFKISDPCKTSILNGWINVAVSNRARNNG